MKPELQEELRARIAAAGLGNHEAKLLATAQVAITVLLEAPSQAQVGESRIGGAPDVPPGFEWPTDEDGAKFVFLLQINLADVPPFEGNPLPATGLLLFFIGLDEPATDVEYAIFHFEGDLQRAELPAPDEFCDDSYLELSPYRLKCALRADLPRWATKTWQQLVEGMSEAEEDALNDMGRDAQGCIGQLLGYVSGIGHDPQQDAYVVRECNRAWLYNYAKRRELDMAPSANWINLLRLESARKVGLCIWDAGYLNFLVHREDLAEFDLSRVYAAVESS